MYFVKKKYLNKKNKFIFLQGCEEYMNGRAGYVLGSLFLRQHFPDDLLLNVQEDLLAICLQMLQVGRDYSVSVGHSSPLMYTWHDSEYFGAAHGISSILLAFLSVPGIPPNDQKDVKESVDYLLSLQTASGNFPSSSRWIGKPRKDEDELVHWCHGASGIVYLMAKGMNELVPGQTMAVHYLHFKFTQMKAIFEG